MNIRRIHLTVVFLACMACADKTYTPELQSLADAPAAFRMADRARNQGEYAQASRQYATLQNQPGDDSLYARYNRELCRMLANDTTTSRILPGCSDTAGPLVHMLHGIQAIHLGKSGTSALQQSRRQLERAHSTATFEYFITLKTLAASYRHIDGQMDSALHYFKAALGMTQAYPELQLHAARLGYETADACMVNRDEVNGLGYINDALRQTTDTLLTARCLITKSTLFRKIERYDSAEKIYARAEAIITRHELPALRPMLWQEQAFMAIVRKQDSLFYQVMSRIDTLCNHGACADVDTDRLWGYYYFETGRPQPSIVHYERALSRLTARRVPDLVQLMETYYVLTDQCTQTKQFDKAEQYAFEALLYGTPLRGATHSWKNLRRPEVTDAIYNFVNYDLLADILLQRGIAENKRDHVRKALSLYTLIDSLMLQQVRVVEEEAVINFLAVGRKIYSGGIAACFDLYEQTRDTVYLGQAHQFMERTKTLMMYRDILAHTDLYFPEVPTPFRERELQLKATISALRRAGSFQSTTMMQALRELDAYYIEMEQKYPAYFRAKYTLRIPSFRHIQQILRTTHTDAVQYHLTKKYIYSLTYGVQPQFQRITRDSTFDQAIIGLRLALDHPPDITRHEVSRQFMTFAHFLHARLVAPLHRKTNALLVIPDGSLSYIPFEILMSGAAENFRQADYLINTCVVNYAPSFKIYDLTANREKREIKRVLTYDYGQSSHNDLVALSGTASEAGLIGQIFTPAVITARHGDDVTPTRLVADLQGPYDLMHIGLHASSSDADRFDNKILCAQGQEPAEIYGYEIAPLHIRSQMVVLTSCRSSYGALVQGEGTYSLARAFKQAGVRTVIASLWDVPDRTTAGVTADFYRHLKKGYPAAASLAEAKRRYLNHADELTAHPYFWAALVCQEN